MFTTSNPLTLYLLAGAVIFAAQVVATVTGFGGNILALPLLALIVGLAPAKAAVVVLTTLVYLALLAKWWRRVKTRELVVICIVCGVGLVAGMLLFEFLPHRASIILLGVFVTIVGLQGLLRPHALRLVPTPVAKVLLFLGGVVHGAFTVGGPLMVIYCRRAIPDKTAFRSTLNVTWIVLNFGLMAGWTITRDWPDGTLRLTLVGLPFSIVALFVGEWIHHRVHAVTFQICVNAVLVITGVMLALSTGS